MPGAGWGFEEGFVGPRVLIPRGVKTTQMRLRAAYVDSPLTFQDIIQAIVIPHGEERRGKLLTALLNSKVALWYAFHATASFGSERPEVKQAELLRLPFPSPGHLPQPKRSLKAEAALVAIIDKAMENASGPFSLRSDDAAHLARLDHLACDYFCLSDNEITLINDAVERVIPAAQPSQGSLPEIWKPANHNDRRAYATTLVRSMADWFSDGCAIGVRLEACNNDLTILRLNLEEGGKQTEYVEENDRSVGEALSGIFKHIHRPLPGNFQLMPDFRVFIGRNLYLVKPTQKRFWLKSTALADADAIALDLQDAAGFRDKRSHA